MRGKAGRSETAGAAWKPSGFRLALGSRDIPSKHRGRIVGEIEKLEPLA